MASFAVYMWVVVWCCWCIFGDVFVLIFEVMFCPFVGVGRLLVLAGVVLCISATISGMFSGVRRWISGVNWFVVVISVLGSGVFRRVLFMCLCGELCQFWLYVSSDVSWLGMGSWLCFMFKGWYGEFLSFVDGCSCYCGGGLVVRYVMFVFLCLLERVGMLWRLLDVRGEPPPVLASLSSIVCLSLSLLLNVGMVRMCICGRCLRKSGRKRNSLYVFALFLARLKSAVGACYVCFMLLNVV